MRTIPACLLLLIGILCAAFLPHGGGGSVTACVTGVPSPDGTVYLPPSNCTISDSGGNVWAIGPSDGFQQILQENGAAVLCCGGGHYRDNGIAIADTHTFMWQWSVTTGMGSSLGCRPGTPANIWLWAHNDSFVAYQQTAGPGSPLTPPSFVVTPGPTNVYNLLAAVSAVAVNGTIEIPAPPGGQLLWNTGAQITKAGVTIRGDVGADIGCATTISGGQLQLDAANITITGADSTHLLTIEGSRGQCNNCGVGIRIGSDAPNFTLTNLLVQNQDDCIESRGNNGSGSTATNIYLRNCGVPGDQGQDHGAYWGYDSFNVEPDIDNIVTNCCSSINTQGAGHIWKNRYAYGTVTNFVFGCDTIDTNYCEPSSIIDDSCGGKRSYSHVVIEVPPTMLALHGFITLGPETSSNIDGACPATHGIAGITATAGSNVISTPIDPATLGIGIGDDISNSIQNPASTPANQTGSWPTHSLITGLTSSTITLNNSATKSGSGLYVLISGPTRFTGNTVAGTNQITGITLNPAPIGAAQRQTPNVSSSTSEGVWAGYRISGTGIPTGATVNTTGGSAGAYTVTINCPDLTTTCITSSNTGAAYAAMRQQSIDLGNCIIINDGPNSLGIAPIIIAVSSGPVMTGVTATVHDCVLVDNLDNPAMPDNIAMGFGTGVTDGGGNTRFRNRAAAGYAAFPFLPSPP